MKSPHISTASRRKPLATYVAIIFALSAPAAATAATTWTVNNCSEGTSGSGATGTLRYALANAVSGDVVDMTTLACSTISLKTGALLINQTNLTLNGPGQGNLLITGKYNNTIEADRVINHQGNGNLYINDMAIAFGAPSSTTANVYGGCIYSKGSAFLNHVGVYLCQASVSGNHTAAGGGVFTRGELSLKYSNVSFNGAAGDASATALGGGARVEGLFNSKYSAISGNSALPSSGAGLGGGLNLRGDVSMRGTTVSSNSANFDAGIDIFNVTPGSLSTYISNSTISGNEAGSIVGGVYTNSGTVTLRNSTIAFNTAASGRVGSSFPFTYFAPGFSTSAALGSMTVNLQSSLISNNTYGTNNENDFSKVDGASTSVTFDASSANNLVRASFDTLPAGTLRFSCPLLGPLRDNGGVNLTHALLSHSPAIDVGNNSAPALSFDTRGSGYPRVDHAVADIGAYEVQQADVVFNTSFEGCPLLF